MIYSNNDQLQAWLQADHSETLASLTHFEFDDDCFRLEVTRVEMQHGTMRSEQIAVRAAYHLLMAGRAKNQFSAIRQNPLSKWFHKMQFNARLWFWLRIAWGIALLFLIVTIAAKAAPGNAVPISAVVRSLRASPPQFGGIVLQLQQAGSTLATRGGGLVNLNCGSGMSCSFSGVTFTMTATGGGGGGSCTPPGTQYALLYDSTGGNCGDLASIGTTTTLLHGNAAGLPTFGAVVLSTDVSGQLPIGAVGSSGLSGTSPIAISAAGAISCSTCATSSGVTSIATTAPITGGTITTTGTIACSTCVTSAAALTSNAVVIGGGLQASSTISADTTTTHALFATGTAPAFRAIASGDLPALSTTVNSQTCTIGSTCTIPFQTNGSGNTSQAGINLLTSTANSVGLTVTPTNSATSAEKFEITGSSYTGNAATATSAAKWTTARNLADNSVDGSGNVAFANAFIVQGTADAGLSGAQFLGALGTGIVKNTTTTGVLSAAAASDVVGLFSGCSGVLYLGADGACHAASGSGTVTVVGAGSLTSTALVTGGGTTTVQTPSATATLDSSGNMLLPGTLGVTGHVTLEGVTSTGAQGTGALVFAGTPTLTTPVIGAATGTSLFATGNVDGTSPLTITTGTTFTFGTTGTVAKHEYYFNEEATAGTGVNGTLPTAAAGLQYCVANAYNGSNPNTGVLTITTSASGQFIIFTDGTLSATGGNVTSGGAAADGACVVGLDSTHWFLYVQSGTWTKH